MITKATPHVEPLEVAEAPAGKRTYLHSDRSLETFCGRCLVVCPACEKQAVVDRIPVRPHPVARLTCSHCGYARGVLGIPWYLMGGPVDPFFRLPLWIQGNFRGKVLWAYSWEHLAFLEDAIAAELRPGSPSGKRGLRNKLPKWMLLARHREDLLKLIQKLRHRNFRRV